jgi:cell shape-determining protein MreC
MSGEFRKGLVDVVRQIEQGYSRVMLMYSVAFYVGIALICLSVLSSLWFKENLAVLIFGGLGMADVVTTFIFRPAQELQNSRGNLTQLQAAFFNWANDVRNWTAYLERLDLRAGNQPPYEEFERVSQKMLTNTAEMMRLVDLYCEIRPRGAAGGGDGTEQKTASMP